MIPATYLLLFVLAAAVVSGATATTVAPGELDPRCMTPHAYEKNAPSGTGKKHYHIPSNAWDKTGASHTYPTGPPSCNSQSRNLTSNPAANLYPTCLLPCTPRIKTGMEGGVVAVYALWALTALVVALFAVVKFVVLSLQGRPSKGKGTLNRRESFRMPHSRRQSVHRTHGDEVDDDGNAIVQGLTPWSFGGSSGGGSTGGTPGSGGGIEMKECGNVTAVAAAEAMDISLNVDALTGDQSGDTMHVQTFSDSSYLGRFALFLLLIISVQWIVFFLVLVFDYYWECQWTGVDGMCRKFFLLVVD